MKSGSEFKLELACLQSFTWSTRKLKLEL